MENTNAKGNSAQTQEVRMARFVSSTDLAIALAQKAGTLALVERPSRFGDTYVSIEDAHGVIEVQLSWAEAAARVLQIAEMAA